MQIMYLVDRPAEDAAKVAGWFLENCGEDGIELWLPLIGGMLSQRVLPTTFVAVDKGEVVGTASLVAADSSALPQYSPWLASVFVPPSAQGRGACGALLRRVEAEARALGFPRLYFKTSGTAEPYEQLGWRWIGSTIVGAQRTKVLALELARVERAA
jgi:predicted N-acetyltransferase YhbS